MRETADAEQCVEKRNIYRANPSVGVAPRAAHLVRSARCPALDGQEFGCNAVFEVRPSGVEIASQISAENPPFVSIGVNGFVVADDDVTMAERARANALGREAWNAPVMSNDQRVGVRYAAASLAMDTRGASVWPGFG